MKDFRSIIREFRRKNRHKEMGWEKEEWCELILYARANGYELSGNEKTFRFLLVTHRLKE